MEHAGIATAALTAATATGGALHAHRQGTGFVGMYLVLSVAFTPDGRSALSGSDDKTLKLWDLAIGKLRGDRLSGRRGVGPVVCFGSVRC